MEPRSLALQADSLTSDPPGKGEERLWNNPSGARFPPGSSDTKGRTLSWVPPPAQESQVPCQALGTDGPASFLLLWGSCPSGLGPKNVFLGAGLSSNTSLAIKVSFRVVNSKKKDVWLSSKGLTSSLFFACQGGATAEKMKSKEEKVKIITEVSGGLDVPDRCVSVCMHVCHTCWWMEVRPATSIYCTHTASVGLPQWLRGKESTRNAGDTGNAGSIPGSGRSPRGGHDNPLQYSCQENPMDRGAWRATVHGVTKSRTWLSMLCHHFVNSNRQQFWVTTYNRAQFCWSTWSPKKFNMRVTIIDYDS